MNDVIVCIEARRNDNGSVIIAVGREAWARLLAGMTVRYRLACSHG
jgi:hypothetical protein